MKEKKAWKKRKAEESTSLNLEGGRLSRTGYTVHNSERTLAPTDERNLFTPRGRSGRKRSRILETTVVRKKCAKKEGTFGWSITKHFEKRIFAEATAVRYWFDLAPKLTMTRHVLFTEGCFMSKTQNGQYLGLAT